MHLRVHVNNLKKKLADISAFLVFHSFIQGALRMKHIIHNLFETKFIHQTPIHTVQT